MNGLKNDVARFEYAFRYLKRMKMAGNVRVYPSLKRDFSKAHAEFLNFHDGFRSFIDTIDGRNRAKKSLNALFARIVKLKHEWDIELRHLH
jgi:hypothetical protein